MDFPETTLFSATRGRMRELTQRELGNVAFLTAHDIPYGVLELTATGLAKSILDATTSFREFLQANAIHDYGRQPQGPDFKAKHRATLAISGFAAPSVASLYRPRTKNGDPRIWFQGLRAMAKPNDIVSAIWADGQFVVLNLSGLDLPAEVSRAGAIKEFIDPFVVRKESAVEQLLEMLRRISEKGFLPVPVRGSTAVGRLLEDELGIAINSRREPDFMGIEIKSSRSSSNRTTLFAKTPDWASSRFGSSRELLAEYGYEREGKRKLSCTISGIVTNSQGLRLRVGDSLDELEVEHVGNQITKAVRWDLEVLRHSLATKHNETFWVKAETRTISGWEYIRFDSVQHTKKPITEQLPTLLSDGKVTVDFLIRETGDKGYLFKMLPKNLPFLFPPASNHQLSTVKSTNLHPRQMDQTLF